ncbi:MAG: sensor histidine kinase [Xenococcaceae cyanobacterium]
MRNSYNLLINAIKYSPKSSAIAVELISQENTIIFKIKDNGIGIPPKDRSRLFSSFHRASNVGDIPGTGLGLAIVKQSVELHGATVNFQSEVDKGTTFVITLPRGEN